MMKISFQGIVTSCITPDFSDNPFKQKKPLVSIMPAAAVDGLYKTALLVR